jgi:hypothetical protein
LGAVPPPPPPVHRGQTAGELRDQIVDCLISHGIHEEPPTAVLTGHLKQAIATIGNLKDNRSIQNWINFLVIGGVLKPITKQQFEVVYDTEEEQPSSSAATDDMKGFGV